MAAHYLSLAALALLCFTQLAQAGVTSNVPKYSDYDAWGSGQGQFAVTLKTGKISSGKKSDPLTDPKDLTGCLNQEYVLDQITDECNSPPIKDNSADVIQVTASLADASAGLMCQVKGEDFSDSNRAPTKKATPGMIEAKLCYSPRAFLNRPWRKKNKPFPSLSLNCPWLVEKVDIDSANANGEWTMTKFFDDFDEVPTATYFAMVHLKSTEGGVCGYTNTAETAYLMTEVDMGRTPGVTAAAIVFSIFSVVFLVVYTTADYFWYNKTGKGLTFGVR